MASWDTIMGFLKAISEVVESLPANTAIGDPTKFEEIAGIVKGFTDLDSKSEDLLRDLRKLNDRLTEDKTIDQKFSHIQSLLDEAHTAVDNAKTEVAGLWGQIKKAGKTAIAWGGGSSWISLKPKIDKVLDGSKNAMKTLEKTFDDLIKEYKKEYKNVATLNEEQSRKLRNEFKEEILKQMVILCNKIKSAFDAYANHKFNVSGKSETGKPIVEKAERVLFIYLLILSYYAGIVNNTDIDNKTEEQAMASLAKSVRATPKGYGPENGCFGVGAIAKLFDTIYQQMFEKANKEFNCWDGKCVLESRSGN